jgi:D-alanyl-D-alanine carboxypeptidase
VKTVSVKPGTLQPAEPKHSQGFAPLPATTAVPTAVQAPAKPETPKGESTKAVRIAEADETPTIAIAKIDSPADTDPPAPAAAVKSTPSPVPAPAAKAVPVPTPAATRTAAAVPPPAKSVVRSGWMIQVGAFTAEQEAKQRLSSIQNKASKVVDGTDPFTESVEKGGNTFYRARFAGFDKNKAEAACKALKRDGVECVTIRN